MQISPQLYVWTQSYAELLSYETQPWPAGEKEMNKRKGIFIVTQIT